MNQNIKENYWILVEVRSGIPTSVKLFREKRKAVLHEKIIRSGLNLENDETAIFKISPSQIHN